jgi:FkbM family methyltransferase
MRQIKIMYNISSSCQISELGEIYSKYFPNIKDGTFIEVGAYDGNEFSNTSCLSDIGWNGLYIEPIEEFYIRCLNRHRNNKVFVENCSVGSFEGEIDIYVNGAVTTSSEKLIKTYYDVGWISNHNTRKCKQYRLDTLLKKYKICKNFDILVVDVEGNETDVFNSFDLEYWYPKMIIVELIDDHETFKFDSDIVKTNLKLREKIANLQYKEIYRDDINTIFVSN